MNLEILISAKLLTKGKSRPAPILNCVHSKPRRMEALIAGEHCQSSV